MQVDERVEPVGHSFQQHADVEIAEGIGAPGKGRSELDDQLDAVAARDG